MSEHSQERTFMVKAYRNSEVVERADNVPIRKVSEFLKLHEGGYGPEHGTDETITRYVIVGGVDPSDE